MEALVGYIKGTFLEGRIYSGIDSLNSACHELSGIQRCGSKYRRLVRKREGKDELGTWCCANRIVKHDGTCRSITLKESTIEETYLKALKQIVDTSVMQKVLDNIEEILCVKVDEQMAAVEEKIIELQGRAISLHRAKKSGEITVEDYNAMLAYISMSCQA